MKKIRQNILKTLAYFDIFNYPLSKEEVRRFLPYKYTQLLVNKILYQLVRENRIYNVNDFYSLQNNRSLAEIKVRGKKRAGKLLRIARHVAKILSWFPYVQCIAVSGSLSKNFADEKADIDFFIITSPNRLWIARTCMHVFKKFTFLAGKQNWFCMNYYIDEMKMEIIEKNVFTAMEIVTLMPLQGITCFQNFIKANSWTNHYFRPQTFSEEKKSEIKKVLFRKCVEAIFNSHAGDIFEKWLMNLTDKRWKKKTVDGRVNDHGMQMAMITSPHFSKPDPRNFQEKVLFEYERRIKQLNELNEPAIIE